MKPPLFPQTHTHSNHGDDTPFQQLCARPYEMGQWKSPHLQYHHHGFSVCAPRSSRASSCPPLLDCPESLSLRGVASPPLSGLTCLFMLSGWVAGLRGGAVQHGTDAGQQHSRPEEDDVTFGPRTEGQSREPPGPLAAQPQPQSRTPGSPWTGPPQPHGPPVSRELPTLGEEKTHTHTHHRNI